MKGSEDSYDTAFERVYNHIVKHGLSAFSENGSLSLYAYRNKPLLENLIKHYELDEQYEKCCFLKVIRDHLNS